MSWSGCCSHCNVFNTLGGIMIHRKQMVEFADVLVEFYNSGKKSIEITEIEKEIAHVLNKNSLRFNPYRFRNYILARTKKADTTKAV
tara:strand:+ start:95 stop:355 length:261 start_codon:yes stop_codon:yes gene_type:complete